MIEIRDLDFSYADRAFRLRVPELRIARGERVALIGPSGVGKTTLAYLIAGILSPWRGSIRAGGVEVATLNDAARRNFRIAHIGFVFQEFELLEYLSVLDNILLPFRLNPALRLTAEARASATELAGAMRLGDKLRRYPQRLSQGERQRVAICRALITQPELIIADEPTGNLDPCTAETILALLLDESSRRGATLLMITHNHALLERFDRVVDVGRLSDGRVA